MLNGILTLVGLVTCCHSYYKLCRGTVLASLLVYSPPDFAVQVWALTKCIVLFSWTRHVTLTVPLSNHVYKWAPANLMLGDTPVMDKHPIHGRAEILLVTLCYMPAWWATWLVCKLYLLHLSMGCVSCSLLHSSLVAALSLTSRHNNKEQWKVANCSVFINIRIWFACTQALQCLREGQD